MGDWSALPSSLVGSRVWFLKATIPEDARTEAANVNQTTAEKIHLKEAYLEALIVNPKP